MKGCELTIRKWSVDPTATIQPKLGSEESAKEENRALIEMHLGTCHLHMKIFGRCDLPKWMVNTRGVVYLGLT